MYARLLFESLRRDTRRKLLAIIAVTLGTLAATALCEVLLGSGDRVAAEMSSYGANIEVVPAPGLATVPAARLGELRKIFWKNNIIAFAPLLDLHLRFSPATPRPAEVALNRAGTAATRGALSPPGTPGLAPGVAPGGTVATAVGTWFRHRFPDGWSTGLPAVRPTLALAGRWPGEDRPEIVLGRRLARRLGTGAGGRLEVSLGASRRELAVVGLVESGGEEDEEAFLPLAEVARLTGQPESFRRAEIYAQTNPESGNVRDPRTMTPAQYDTWYCTAYPSSVAFQIGQAVPEARSRVVHGLTAATADVLGRLRAVLLCIAVVALAGAAVGVTAAMTATVLERRLEAGLLVAIGAGRRRVVAFFLSEAALLGGVGGAAGGALGLFAGRLLGRGLLAAPVPWTPVLLPFAFLLGLVLAVLASAAPVTRALGRYPATLLKRATT